MFKPKNSPVWWEILLFQTAVRLLLRCFAEHVSRNLKLKSFWKHFMRAILAIKEKRTSQDFYVCEQLLPEGRKQSRKSSDCLKRRAES